MIIYFLITLIFPSTVLAHCPLCVAGAAGGLTLSRLLGIDDSITGVWLGAFLGAISFWSERFLIKRYNLRLLLRPVIYGGILGLTLWSFYKFNLIVKHGDIFGVDKLTFGMITGGVVFYLVDFIDDLVIRIRGKSFFPYQRVVVGLGSMLFLSLIIYYLINYVI